MSVLIVAEARLNHDGRLGNAILTAEVAAECGDGADREGAPPATARGRKAPEPV